MPLDVDTIRSLHASTQTAFQALIEAVDGETDSITLAKAEEAVLIAVQNVETTILTPADRALRLGMLPAINTAAKIAQLLDIFNILQEEMSIDELAQQTRADPILLLRVMRCLTAYKFFTQIRANHYQPTAFSRKLAEGPAGNWIKICYDIGQAMNRGIVPALIRTDFQNPKDPSGSGAVEVWGQSLFQYLAKDPHKAAEFGVAMEVQSELEPAYYAHFPFSEAKEELSKLPRAVTLVDVGGGHGHVLANIIKDNPKLRGRFVVQDLPVVVDELKLRDVPFEPMVQDFFEPQSLTDVKFWHLRHILHDWPDAECLTILTHLRNACITTNTLHATRSYARILIQEFVLSDVHCGQREAVFDIMMMAWLGMERSEGQWTELLRRSGLKIVKIWRAAVGDYGIIEAEPDIDHDIARETPEKA